MASFAQIDIAMRESRDWLFQQIRELQVSAFTSGARFGIDLQDEDDFPTVEEMIGREANRRYPK